MGFPFRYSSNLWNNQSHFWFNGNWVEEMIWASLPSASKSVLPVILSYQIDTGWAFPGELTIASLAGVSTKTARQGVRGIEGIPDIEIKQSRTRRGLSTQFRYTRPKKENSMEFPFYSNWFIGGNWYFLHPSAMALYPVMRHFSVFNLAEYEENSEDDDHIDLTEDFEEDSRIAYANRKFDICRDSIANTDLCRYAGIHRNSFSSSIDSLWKYGFVKPAPFGGYKVYIKPLKYYKPKSMNELILKRFGCEQEKY